MGGDSGGTRDERYLLTDYDADQWTAAHPGGEPIEYLHVLAHLRAEHIYRGLVHTRDDLNPFFLAHPAVDTTNQFALLAGNHCHPRT